MTDKTKNDAVTPQDAAAAAEGADQAQDAPNSETVSGGRYLLNGKIVNANGEPITGKAGGDE